MLLVCFVCFLWGSWASCGPRGLRLLLMISFVCFLCCGLLLCALCHGCLGRWHHSWLWQVASCLVVAAAKQMLLQPFCCVHLSMQGHMEMISAWHATWHAGEGPGQERCMAGARRCGQVQCPLSKGNDPTFGPHLAPNETMLGTWRVKCGTCLNAKPGHLSLGDDEVGLTGAPVLCESPFGCTCGIPSDANQSRGPIWKCLYATLRLVISCVGEMTNLPCLRL